jgi:hypothetical protein
MLLAFLTAAVVLGDRRNTHNRHKRYGDGFEMPESMRYRQDISINSVFTWLHIKVFRHAVDIENVGWGLTHAFNGSAMPACLVRNNRNETRVI